MVLVWIGPSCTICHCKNCNCERRRLEFTVSILRMIGSSFLARHVLNCYNNSNGWSNNTNWLNSSLLTWECLGMLPLSHCTTPPTRSISLHP